MKMGPQLIVSSDILEKPGIQPVTTGLQGEWLIRYTATASNCNMSQCMRFPTMWYVRPAKPQISLC